MHRTHQDRLQRAWLQPSFDGIGAWPSLQGPNLMGEMHIEVHDGQQGPGCPDLIRPTDQDRPDGWLAKSARAGSHDHRNIGRRRGPSRIGFVGFGGGGFGRYGPDR